MPHVPYVKADYHFRDILLRQIKRKLEPFKINSYMLFKLTNFTNKISKVLFFV